MVVSSIAFSKCFAASACLPPSAYTSPSWACQKWARRSLFFGPADSAFAAAASARGRSPAVTHRTAASFHCQASCALSFPASPSCAVASRPASPRSASLALLVRLRGGLIQPGGAGHLAQHGHGGVVALVLL